MNISPVTISAEDLVAQMKANEPNERSTGLHQSDIIKSILRDLDPKRFGIGPMPMEKIEGGFCFEMAIEAAMCARHPGLIRPGELERDGITGSPDGIDVAENPWRLYEFKQTEMSIGGGIRDPKFQHWIWQIRGYLYMLDGACRDTATGLHRARLIGDFLRGHYKYEPVIDEFGRTLPPGRLLLGWDFYFTDNELLMNWANLVKHARMKGLM